MSLIVIDFETTKIINGSNKAPTPVGVAIRYNDDESKYLAWGHPTNNNSTIEEAAQQLTQLTQLTQNIFIMHNVKFDLRILNESFNISIPPNNLLDTMIMAYLYNPRELSLGLKQLALKYCNYPAINQDKLYEWLITHTKATNKTAGEYISEAPGDLAGYYAIDDVNMAYELAMYYINKNNYEYYRRCFK